MNGFSTSIDTDAGIGTILSHFSSEYITHVVEDSLNMRFRPFMYGPMPNMVDVLERQFLSIDQNAKDYSEKISEVRLDTCQEIILKICKFYNLEFEKEFDMMRPEEIYSVARTLYDIFISHFTEYLIEFFVSYIINNADDIANYLQLDENSIKPKESTSAYSSANPDSYIDPKYVLIHANINQVIYNMSAYDIPLDVLLRYFLDPKTAEQVNSYLEDCGDIYRNYYACYILDQRYAPGVLTNIKLSLQGRTKQINEL